MMQQHVAARQALPQAFNVSLVPENYRNDFQSWHSKTPQEQLRFMDKASRERMGTPEAIAYNREDERRANPHTQAAYQPAWTPSPQGTPAGIAAPASMAHQGHADMAARMPQGQHRTLRDTWGAEDVAGNGRLLGSIMTNAEAQARAQQLPHGQNHQGMQDVNRGSLPDLERAYEEARLANNVQQMTDIARRIYAIDPYAAHAVR